MDNKGQSLVMFVLLLPIILVLVAGVIDLGNYSVTKGKYENEIKSTIKYGLNHPDVSTSDLEKLLNSNLTGVKKIDKSDNMIKIKVTTKVNSLFSNIIKLNYDIDLSYSGYKENNKIIIKKE